MNALLPLLAILAVSAPPGGAETPASLQRTLRSFDFEESTTHRLDMPLGFQRVNPLESSRPNSFGTMGPDGNRSRSGRYSFRFDLDGHSMAARSLPGLIPVRNGSDYQVRCWIRAEGFQHASAGVVAWLVDAEGQPAPGSIQRTEVPPDREWVLATVNVPATGTPAHDLVIELFVLQPGNGSMEQDIRGTAWFDDISVVQLPSVHVDDNSGTGIHRLPSMPRLHLSIDDPSPDPIDWTLVIEDAGGTMIQQESGRVTDTQLDATLDLELPACGWYRATLEASAVDMVTRRDQVDLVLLPTGDHAGIDPLVGIDLPEPPVQADLEMAGELGTGLLGIPAIQQDGTGLLEDDGQRRLLGRFLDAGGAISCRFDQLPAAWSRKHALDEEQVARFILVDEATWGPVIDRTVGRFGDQAAWWRLQAEDDAIEHASVEPAAAALHARIMKLAPEARVTIETDAAGRTDAIEQLAQAWRNGHPYLLDPPWTVDDRGRQRPSREFPAIHAMAQHLKGRRFGGSFPIEGGEAWLLEGISGHSSALLIRPGPGTGTTVPLSMGTEDVIAHDLQGNRTRIEFADQTHVVPVDGQSMCFIEGIDEAQVQFHRDLQMEPTLVVARPRRSRHELVVTNPWNRPLDGVLRFKAGERLFVEPGRIPLHLAAGSSRRIPIELVVEGPLAPGPGQLEAVMDIASPHQRSFPVQCWIEVGLPGIDVQVTYERESDGLIVLLQLHNESDERKRIQATIVGKELATMPMEQFEIAPGATVMHRFELLGTATHLDGRTFHLRIGEVDATGLISKAIVVPEGSMEPATSLSGVQTGEAP